jgi:DNA-binding XRE family transcriptional regulator
MTMIQIQADTMPEVLLVTRRAAGLSLRAIADKVGVTHTTARAWENGQSEPSAAQFIRWARACNQPALQLLDGLMMAGYGDAPAASATGASECATRDSNPQPSDPYLGGGCPCRANDYHGRGDCPFGCSCGWCAPELWDSEDPYRDAATFWTDERALILASLWRQVEPDTESTLPEAVA